MSSRNPKSKIQNPKSWLLWGIGAALALLPVAAYAHERFIRHTPKMPLYEPMFTYLGGNMLNIATRVFGLMAIMMFFWFLRQPLYSILDKNIFSKLPTPLQSFCRLACDFAMDKPVNHHLFDVLSRWTVVFFMRSPALVLMFAATNKSLVMPSYPLEPSTTAIFQFAQVVMAIGILTQSFLPMGGATIFGTFVYMLMAYDWKIAVDVLPVLTVAVIYITSPWDSWKQVITRVGMKEMRWVRILLGFGFFALGWMKLYNYYLTVGVADQYMEVMNDPMILLFYKGTNPHLVRECWLIAFGMAEVMTGFLLMLGIFSRIWCFMMIIVFTKLMVVNFGWDEIPHLYPIGAFMVVMFSNNLSNEFGKVDDKSDDVAKTGKHGMVHSVLSMLLGIALSALAVYPLLLILTWTHPKSIRLHDEKPEWSANPGGSGGVLKLHMRSQPGTDGKEDRLHYQLHLLDQTTLDASGKHPVQEKEGEISSNNESLVTYDLPKEPTKSTYSLSVTLFHPEDAKGDHQTTVPIPFGKDTTAP